MLDKERQGWTKTKKSKTLLSKVILLPASKEKARVLLLTNSDL